MPHSRFTIPDSKFRPSGFTLLELILTVAIVAVVATSGILSWSSYQRKQVTTAAVQGLSDILREAQGNALSRAQDTSWCVRITNSAGLTASYAELFSSADCSGTAQRRITFSSLLEFSDPPDGQSKTISFAERLGTLQNGGHAAVSYYDNTGSDLKFAYCGNLACNTNNVVSSPDSAGFVGDYTATAIGADGLPVVAYNAGGLRILKCGNVFCNAANNTITTIDTANAAQQTAIAVGADNLPVVSYWMAPSSLKVLKCGNAACSSGSNTITVVDTIDTLGNIGHSSIAIGTDGLPVIAYNEQNPNYDLKVLKCGNAACSLGNTITRVDTVGDTGWFPSLAIGQDGLPVISEYDAVTLDLKVLKCGNAACSLGNTMTTVDSVGDVGRDTALAVPQDGLPVIGYYDNTNGWLKVLKCGNAYCSSGNVSTQVDTVSTGAWLWTAIGIASSGDGFPLLSYRYVNSEDLRVLKCGNAACSLGNTMTTVDSVGQVGQFSSIAFIPFEALTFFRSDMPTDVRTVSVGSQGGVVVQ